jgi:acyl-CoA reductase-like NAD-dependent aldehyde dehydrogenase
MNDTMKDAAQATRTAVRGGGEVRTVRFFIAGKSTGSIRGKETREVRNPADGSIVAEVPHGTAEDADAAVEAARAAFPKWWATPASTRGRILHAAANAIVAHVEELAHLLTSEQGKPLVEARMEIHRFAHTLEHYAGLAKNLRGGYVPDLDEKPHRHGLILKRPLGVCAAIVPWNFPVSLMGNKLGPAIVAGNTVVVKPAATTPLTSTRAIEILYEAGLPAGVVNTVFGDRSHGDGAHGHGRRCANHQTRDSGARRLGPHDRVRRRRHRPRRVRGFGRPLLQLRTSVPGHQARFPFREDRR